MNILFITQTVNVLFYKINNKNNNNNFINLFIIKYIYYISKN